MASFRLLLLAALGAAFRRSGVNLDTGTKMDTEMNTSWSFCVHGTCWKKLDPGMGGVGTSGCIGFWGQCGGGGKSMRCRYGPCPNYFGSGCVSDGSCKSYCAEDEKSCFYSGPPAEKKYLDWMSRYHELPLKDIFMVGGHHALARLGTLDFRGTWDSRNVRDTRVRNIPQKLSAFSERVPLLRGHRFRKNLRRVFEASLMPMWFSTQQSTMKRLLENGVRAFDIRPYVSKDGKLHYQHGGLGEEVGPALDEIRHFLKWHDSEVVFVNFLECLDCNTVDLDLSTALTKLVNDNFCDSDTGICIWVCNPNVSQAVEEFAGKVIVHNYTQPLYEPKRHDTNSIGTLQKFVVDDLKNLTASGNQQTMIGVEWILSPQDMDILGAVSQRHILEYQDEANVAGCQSLACFAELASAKSFSTLLNTTNYRALYDRVNFLILDFADRKDTMRQVILTNEYRLARHQR